MVPESRFAAERSAIGLRVIKNSKKKKYRVYAPEIRARRGTADGP